ncbi:MAG TPA: SMP-30/gluconolactonase/LRE family protein [Streptosporangiaceae bacterium]|nr:SMP-30/gluconolactonase/LRE family protein [Streptosporangiaceae bacterium]
MHRFPPRRAAAGRGLRAAAAAAPRARRVAGHACDLSGISDKPWNDIVVDDRCNAYVNTIGFDFPGGEFAPGLVVLATPDGSVRQVAGDVAFPNGMAITADGGTLIVAESYASRLTAYDITAGGGLGNRRVWADTPGDHPDGICIDAEGAVWYADVGNQQCVRVREGGTVLATLHLDRGAFACALSRGPGPAPVRRRPELRRTRAGAAQRAGRGVPGTGARRREALTSGFGRRRSDRQEPARHLAHPDVR